MNRSLAGANWKPALLGIAILATSSTYAELPEEAFTIVRMAIEEAQEVNAGAVAGDEVLQAERKLQEARDASSDDEDETAERLLLQARLHAEHAEVEAMHATAQQTLDELDAALITLATELGRN